MQKALVCPVCSGASKLYDVVDFNKSCEELRGKFLPLSGTPIYYARCSGCGFCYAPEIYAWSLERFEDKIYNKEYVEIDPDYLEDRPKGNAGFLLNIFANQALPASHLDYGGGNGLLSQFLKQYGWNSSSYDPFVNRDTNISEVGKFEFITAYEVFEHVPDVQQLMANLVQLLAKNGVVFFSTLVSDQSILANQRLGWWYASPRNGHISLYTKESLVILAKQHSLNFHSFSPAFHVFYSGMPSWSRPIFTLKF
jgi:SAM-dependent methyltransferase